MFWAIVLVLWVIIGIYSIQNNWRKDLPIRKVNILPLLLFGVIIGPFVGFFDIVCFCFKRTFPNFDWNKEILSKKDN